MVTQTSPVPGSGFEAIQPAGAMAVFFSPSKFSEKIPVQGVELGAGVPLGAGVGVGPPPGVGVGVGSAELVLDPGSSSALALALRHSFHILERVDSYVIRINSAWSAVLDKVAEGEAAGCRRTQPAHVTLNWVQPFGFLAVVYVGLISSGSVVKSPTLVAVAPT